METYRGEYYSRRVAITIISSQLIKINFFNFTVNMYSEFSDTRTDRVQYKLYHSPL